MILSTFFTLPASTSPGRGVDHRHIQDDDRAPARPPWQALAAEASAIGAKLSGRRAHAGKSRFDGVLRSRRTHGPVVVSDTPTTPVWLLP